jgi:hypothetical protein
MTVFQSAVDATFAVFGIDALYTPAGGEPVPVRVIARRSDTIVGFGETRIYAETTTFELRASEVANPRSGDQLTCRSLAGSVRLGSSGVPGKDGENPADERVKRCHVVAQERLCRSNCDLAIVRDQTGGELDIGLGRAHLG